MLELRKVGVVHLDLKLSVDFRLILNAHIIVREGVGKETAGGVVG
jgi:hypothetical protein